MGPNISWSIGLYVTRASESSTIWRRDGIESSPRSVKGIVCGNEKSKVTIALDLAGADKGLQLEDLKSSCEGTRLANDNGRHIAQYCIVCLLKDCHISGPFGHWIVLYLLGSTNLPTQRVPYLLSLLTTGLPFERIFPLKFDR
jgi:hypothetical protein